jgi:hypothetical protein
VGTYVFGTPSVVSFPNTRNDDTFAFVEGTHNCPSHLYVAHYTTTTNWQWEYPSDPVGASISSYPTAVTSGNSGAVFVTGSNGHL